jgi:outer membrane protein OmpA-like peptidoglycan-associated protein
MTMQRGVRGTLLILAVALAASGCATKKYVKQEVEAAEARTGERVSGVETQVEEGQRQIRVQGEEIQGVSRTAQEALDRAIAAGKLAEGKLLYETVLTDEKVKFGFDKSALSDDAKAALDEFADGLKTENEGVFIEIQGHTDAVGSEDYNTRLGEQRAGAVRRYLSLQHSLPLHRISIISYGEAAPISDNGSREGRAQNRRVALVVLK